MKDVHGAAVLRLITEEPGAAPSRYVQNHVSASYANAGYERDFVTQVWFDDAEHMQAALTAARYVEELQPDEDNFVDQSTVIVLPVQEKVMLAPGTSASGKVFVLLRGDGGDFSPDLELGQGIRGLIINSVLRPGSQYDTVYEAWFDDRGAADAAARGWHAKAGDEAARHVLVVVEHVLHAGSRPAVDV
jgi:vanillate O-demethylase ferredoxin subunit